MLSVVMTICIYVRSCQVPFSGAAKLAFVNEIDADPRFAMVVLMARELHRAGITTDRLEIMLTRMAATVGVEVQVFALPTNVTLAIGPAYAQKIVMLRISAGGLDLRRIANLVEIHDAVCAGSLTPQAAIAQIEAVASGGVNTMPLITVAAFCVVSVGTALLLGAYQREMIVASLIGLSTGVIALIARRSRVVAQLFEVSAAFVATMIVAASDYFVGPTNLYISIIAGIVPLLPGYSLTAALYELANGDLVAGMARMGKVVMTILALGCGAALAVTVAGSQFLSNANNAPHPVGWLWFTIAIALMVVGLCTVLNARPRDYVWIFAACYIALVASRVLGTLPSHQASSFGAALISGLVSYVGSRYVRVPQVVLLVPAVFVLVPGALTYESIFYLFQQNYTDALSLAVNAIIGSIFIVAGLLLSQLLFAATALPLRVIRRFNETGHLEGPPRRPRF